MLTELNSVGFIAIADLDTENGSFHDEDTGVFHQGQSLRYTCIHAKTNQNTARKCILSCDEPWKRAPNYIHDEGCFQLFLQTLTEAYSCFKTLGFVKYA